MSSFFSYLFLVIVFVNRLCKPVYKVCYNPLVELVQNVWQYDSMDIYVPMITCKTLSQVQLISWYFVLLFYRIVALLLKLCPCGFMCPWWPCFCQILSFLRKNVTNIALHIFFYSGNENLFFVINHYTCKYWIPAALKAVCANHLNTIILILLEG